MAFDDRKKLVHSLTVMLPCTTDWASLLTVVLSLDPHSRILRIITSIITKLYILPTPFWLISNKLSLGYSILRHFFQQIGGCNPSLFPLIIVIIYRKTRDSRTVATSPANKQIITIFLPSHVFKQLLFEVHGFV